MRPGGPQGLWFALLGVGLVGVVLGAIALARGGDDPERKAKTAPVVAETEAAGTTVVVPDVRGIGFADAGLRAEDAGLVADSFPVEGEVPAGTVVAQEPPPGARVAATRHLRLDVSVGPGELATLVVPDVTGPKAPRARRTAWEQGFTTLTVDRDAPTAEEVDEVILQEPAAGTRAPALTQVTLYVGR